MTETIKDRLKKIAQTKGLSIRSFEESCGLGRGNISNMNQDGSIGSDKLSKIIDTFPEIDLYWLITGKVSPKTTPLSSEQPEQQNQSPIIAQLLDTIKEQAEEIGRLKAHISNLENHKAHNAGDAPISETANVG